MFVDILIEKYIVYNYEMFTSALDERTLTPFEDQIDSKAITHGAHR